MISIDNLKTVINHKIGTKTGNTGTKFSVAVNEDNVSAQNGIFLFYNGESDYISTSQAPYYLTGIQIACKHNSYDKSRIGAFNCIEYIKSNGKTLSGVYFRPNTTPIYLGLDDEGSHIWAFDIFIKGAE